MDSYPVSDSLKDWLDRRGMRSHGAGTPALHENGAGCAEGGNAHPATAKSGGGGRLPIGMGKTGSLSPRQVGQGRNVKNTSGKGDFGEPFPRYVDDTMAEAMSRGRVYRTRPLLIALDGGLSDHD